jgi:hypothetical protein
MVNYEDAVQRLSVGVEDRLHVNPLTDVSERPKRLVALATEEFREKRCEGVGREARQERLRE